MFHAVFERQARRTFELVNQHEYDSILANATPDIRHRFSGDHALAGERHDAAHLRLWFERLHRLMPGLTLTVTDVWVVGGLRRTTVIVRWKAAATLLDGLPYDNHGVHVIQLRNRKATQHRGRRRLAGSRLRFGASSSVRADRGAGGSYHELIPVACDSTREQQVGS